MRNYKYCILLFYFFSGLFVSVYPTKRLEYRTAVLLYAATYCFCYIIHCSTIQIVKVHLLKYRNTEITSFECFKSFFFCSFHSRCICLWWHTVLFTVLGVSVFLKLEWSSRNVKMFLSVWSLTDFKTLHIRCLRSKEFL